MSLHDELIKYPEFKTWLEGCQPNEPDWWESEYSGSIMFALSAWKAARLDDPENKA